MWIMRCEIAPIEDQKPSLSETLAELDSFLYPTIGRMLLTLLTMPAANRRLAFVFNDDS